LRSAIDLQLTVNRQCELLAVKRSSVYRDERKPEPPPETVEVMHQIDSINTAHPTFGYRKITDVNSQNSQSSKLMFK